MFTWLSGAFLEEKDRVCCEKKQKPGLDCGSRRLYEHIKSLCPVIKAAHCAEDMIETRFLKITKLVAFEVTDGEYGF
jgi:hypothetical protein